MRPLLAAALLLLAAAPALPQEDTGIELFPRILVETSHGDFALELDGPRAPISVVNFVTYVRAGHYDGTIFHRVIPGFVAQGGGYTPGYEEKPTRGPVPNESGNGLSNERGTIAMARTGDPHSATSQFYINLGNNEALDPQPARWGYAVFGRVVEGMDVLDKIAALPTGPAGPFPSDVPQSPVVIEKVSVVGAED